MNSSVKLAARLENLVGRGHVLGSEVELRDYVIDGCIPAAIARPASAEQVAEVVRFAGSEKLVVVCCGSRSKLEIGMPPRRYDLALDLSGLVEVAHYDPADLTLSVDAGLRLSELATVLAAKGQFLPLMPPCFGASTVGGTIASGMDFALRLQYGSARDFLIGAEFVDGKGQLCKSGGRVVKNVTGYDIHKLLIGSQGTLAAITRLNFRTFPLPELSAGLLASFRSSESAFTFRKEILDSGLPFASVEVFDPEFATLLTNVCKRMDSNALEPHASRQWSIYAAFNGNEAVVGRVHRELQARANRAAAATAEFLDQRANNSLNAGLREAFDWLRRATPNVALLRISQLGFTPAQVEDLQKGIPQSPLRSAFLFNGCGTALLALLCEDDGASGREALEQRLTELLQRLNGGPGSATLLHAPSWLKTRCNVWGAPPPDFRLMQRVKAAFDPENTFSPGRFVGGI